MKNFYVLLTAAAVTFSASALSINTERAQLRGTLHAKKEVVKANEQTSNKVAQKSVMNEKISNRIAKARKADASTSIEGVWKFAMGDYYYDFSVGGTIYVEYTATYDGSFVYFEEETGDYLPFAATFNEATGKLTFGRTLLGQAAGAYVFQEPYVYNNNTGDLDYQTIYGQFTGTTITFEPDNGIDWVAYSSQNGTGFLGYFDTLDLEGATKIGESTGGENPGGDTSSWEEVGLATFVDGWVLPGFGLDQNDPANQYEVKLEQSTTNSNVYRLVNPYKAGPIAAYNESTKDGYIQFDVTDPDHVVFSTNVDAGFATGQITKFYAYNTIAFYMGYFGVTADEVVEAIGDDIPYTTYKDGVVTLSYIVYEGEKEYDACFGDQTNNLAWYIWEGADMSAKIIFPTESKVDNVSINNESVEAVEYFNLQGIRVAAPEAGQLVIKRQGSQIEKMIVR